MILLRMLEYLFMIAVVWFVGSQVVAPLVTGRGTFPLFGARKIAEDAVAEETEKVEVMSLHEQAEQLRERREGGRDGDNKL